MTKNLTKNPTTSARLDDLAVRIEDAIARREAAHEAARESEILALRQGKGRAAEVMQQLIQLVGEDLALRFVGCLVALKSQYPDMDFQQVREVALALHNELNAGKRPHDEILTDYAAILGAKLNPIN